MSDERGDWESLYGDDPEHPIPFLSQLDVFAEYKNGGGSLTIITAQPLSADQRTMERLLQKIENYLQFVNSDQFPTQYGRQTIDNTEIKLDLMPGTDPVIFDLLAEWVNWVAENNARLVWK